MATAEQSPILSLTLSRSQSQFGGGLFLDPINIVPPSILRCCCSSISFSKSNPSPFPHLLLFSAFYPKVNNISKKKRKNRANPNDNANATATATTVGVFSSLSLNCNPPNNSSDVIDQKGKGANNAITKPNPNTRRRGAALNPTKHLWAGAVAAMVARTVLAPLERLKLEYIVRGEQQNIVELVRRIGSTQGLRGFWKGNLINILRTAPFKAINFCAYDTYSKQLRKMHVFDGTKNLERFVAGAAAGITATILCLPLDTIRTRIVAHGGEKLGGVIGAFRYMIKTEGIFSLYKGLVPSIISVAPSSAVFYGVYDLLKSTYLQSPEGRKRLEKMKLQGQDVAALSQLELGTLRTLLYGAISGACAEAATYPCEVVRRQLQMQVQATKLSAPATFLKIVQEGGIPALYAGLLPSLLQVLPSAAISYFVYECMKIVLKAE